MVPASQSNTQHASRGARGRLAPESRPRTCPEEREAGSQVWTPEQEAPRRGTTGGRGGKLSRCRGGSSSEASVFVRRPSWLQEKSLVLFSLRDPFVNKEILAHGWEPGSLAQGLELGQADHTWGFSGPQDTTERTERPHRVSLLKPESSPGWGLRAGEGRGGEVSSQKQRCSGPRPGEHPERWRHAPPTGARPRTLSPAHRRAASVEQVPVGGESQP